MGGSRSAFGMLEIGIWINRKIEMRIWINRNTHLDGSKCAFGRLEIRIWMARNTYLDEQGDRPLMPSPASKLKARRGESWRGKPGWPEIYDIRHLNVISFGLYWKLIIIVHCMGEGAKSPGQKNNKIALRECVAPDGWMKPLNQVPDTGPLIPSKQVRRTL